MVDTAVILINQFIKNYSGSGWNSQKILLGLSLLERVVLTTNKAGIEKFILIYRDEDKEIVSYIKRSKTLLKKGIKVELLSSGEEKEGYLFKNRIDTHFLLLSDVLVFDPKILSNLKSVKINTNRNALFVDSHIKSNNSLTGVIKVNRDFETKKMVAVGEDLKEYNAFHAGISICAPRLFPKLLEKDYLAVLNEKGFSEIFLPKNTGVVDIGDSFSMNVTCLSKFISAEKFLLNSVRKETDGFVSRNFNRYISLFLSKQLLKLNVSPNQISFANLAIGLLGAWFVSLGGYANTVAGGIMFQLASIIDGNDGEVAKLSHSDSPKGAWIDTFCDAVTYLAFFVGLSIGLYRFENNNIYAVLGALTLLALIILYFLMIHYVNKTKTGGSMLKIINDIETSSHSSNPVTKIDPFVSRTTFALRRDFFAFAFLILSIFGVAWFFMWSIYILTPISIFYLCLFSKRQFQIS